MSTKYPVINRVIILCNPELGLTLDEVLADLGGIKESTLRNHVLTARKAGANVVIPPTEKDMTTRTLTYLRIQLDTMGTTDFETYFFIGERLRKEQSPEVINLVNRLHNQRKKLETDLRKATAELDHCKHALNTIQYATCEVLGSTEEPRFNEALFKRCDELDLSVRSANCLQNTGIEYIWQLVERSEAQMLKIKDFGHKSLNEIKELLAELGLSLGMTLKGFPKYKFTG